MTKFDFVADTRFAAPGGAVAHPMHDAQTKRLRHLNFFQHECFLEIRTPRVKRPDGNVLAMAQQMTFAAVAKLVGESWHHLHRSRISGNCWR